MPIRVVPKEGTRVARKNTFGGGMRLDSLHAARSAFSDPARTRAPLEVGRHDHSRALLHLRQGAWTSRGSRPDTRRPPAFPPARAQGMGLARAFSLARARRERRGLARHTRAFDSCAPAVSGEARSPGERLGLGRVPSASGRSFARPARTRIHDAAADSDPLPSLRSGDRKQVGHVPGPAPGGLLRARCPGRARSAAVLLQAHAHDARRSHRETPQLQHS